MAKHQLMMTIVQDGRQLAAHQNMLQKLGV
jgi:hypothetical protein